MRCGSASFSSSNPLRIPRPKIDKLAYQAQGVGILAVRRDIRFDAIVHIFIFCVRFIFTLGNYITKKRICQVITFNF